jgi:small subunit ribosomal protein S5
MATETNTTNQTPAPAQVITTPVAAVAAPAQASAQPVDTRGMQSQNRRPGGNRPMRRDNNRRPPREKGEFDKKIISIRRVARTYAGGKRMRLSVCLVAGDKKGRVGIGLGKGADVVTAEDKAMNQAKKNMVNVKLKGTTVMHEMFHKKGAAKIVIKPAAPGTGVIAGGALRAVLELAGVKDVLTKVLGTSNPITNAYAAVEALANQKG